MLKLRGNEERPMILMGWHYINLAFIFSGKEQHMNMEERSY